MSEEDLHKYEENAPLAFGLCVGAGLATCVGAAIVYSSWLVKIASKKILAAGLGLSSGVMLYVSFGEILTKSTNAFENVTHDHDTAYAYATLSFFGGVVIMKIIDYLVHLCLPKCTDPKPCLTVKKALTPMNLEASSSEMCKADNVDGCCVQAGDVQLTASQDCQQCEFAPTCDIELDKNLEEELRKKDLARMGIKTALAIWIHNIPEGLATFIATMVSSEIGIPLAIGIAIHNIPEGISVAMPIYYASGNRHKAFLWAFLSGISEPIGALIGWAILSNALDGLPFGILFGLVAGMMVTIVCHELLPTAHKYDPEDKVVTNSLIIGMAIMAASLLLFSLGGAHKHGADFDADHH